MARKETRFLKEFGKRVAKIRKEKGFTQEKLAFAIGVSPAYIGFIEQGRRNPTIANIYKISKALKVSLKDLFSIFE
jgi:transcriptional regulator with XRE-family HTH domain